jgi:hypothetical protein
MIGKDNRIIPQKAKGGFLPNEIRYMVRNIEPTAIADLRIGGKNKYEKPYIVKQKAIIRKLNPYIFLLWFI